MGEAFFRAQPRAFHPVMSHLLDRRMSTKERLSATVSSLRTVCDSVGNEANVRSLLTQGITLLALADRIRIVLSLNDVSFHEGLWQVGLIDEDGLRLYSIGFGCTDAQTLLIGNVQGPSMNFRQVLAGVCAHNLGLPDNRRASVFPGFDGAPMNLSRA